MKCGNCGCETAACADCGATTPIGTAALCETCNAPMDCERCNFTVSSDLRGVLVAANDDT